jgi:hypothetical protein
MKPPSKPSGLLPLLLTAALAGACSNVPESQPASEPMLGTWTGSGRFLDRELAAEHGEFPMMLEVHEDGSVTGTVGSARLQAAALESRPGDYRVAARLDGAVFEAGTFAGEDKDCVVLLLQPDDTARLEGNVHLKTNITFDPRMRVGGLSLARAR